MLLITTLFTWWAPHGRSPPALRLCSRGRCFPLTGWWVWPWSRPPPPRSPPLASMWEPGVVSSLLTLCESRQRGSWTADRQVCVCESTVSGGQRSEKLINIPIKQLVNLTGFLPVYSSLLMLWNAVKLQQGAADSSRQTVLFHHPHG